jgi:hypothetical protein
MSEIHGQTTISQQLPAKSNKRFTGIGGIFLFLANLMHIQAYLRPFSRKPTMELTTLDPWHLNLSADEFQLHHFPTHLFSYLSSQWQSQ